MSFLGIEKKRLEMMMIAYLVVDQTLKVEEVGIENDGLHWCCIGKGC